MSSNSNRDLSSNGDLSSESQEEPSEIAGTVRSPIPQIRDTLIADFPPRYRKRPAQEDTNVNESQKRRKLAEPKLIFKGSFESARDEGQRLGKWLMVNLQNSQRNCGEQNRNVWKVDKVKKLVSQNFILWQVYHTKAHGNWYKQLYQPIEFPYVAIVDPRTGEKLQVWNQIDSETICGRIDKFLSEFDEKFWDRSSEIDDNTEAHLLDNNKAGTSVEGL